MRVVMLLGRSTGGIGTHVAQLSASLRDRGVDVVVVTHPLTAQHFDFGQVRLLWPGCAGMVHALRDFRLLRRLVSTADIVHAHGHQGGLLATVATRSGRIRPDLGGGPRPRRPKLIVSQHNIVLAGSGRQALKRLSQRWVAHRADLVTGASSDLVAEALACGASRAELAEVPSPRVPALLAQRPADGPARAQIRQTLFSSLSLDTGQGLGDLNAADPSAPLVVTISRIAPQKNLPVLVQAASRLRHTCTWVVLGDGDPQLMAQLRRATTRASPRDGSPGEGPAGQGPAGQGPAGQEPTGRASAVYFVGPRGDIDQWLRAAEVFVLPSEWEARALVVQEAMAAGTPVVVTDVGGLHDLVRGTGLLVPPGDPEAIAKSVDRVLGDPALREALAGHGREVAKTLPDGSDTASRWLAWYCETAPMT